MRETGENERERQSERERDIERAIEKEKVCVGQTTVNRSEVSHLKIAKKCW